MSVKIITDSGSDMMDMQNDVISCLPLTIRFGEEEFKDGQDISHHEFYEKLVETDDFPQTSQATPFDFANAIEEGLKEADEVIVMPISSKLSGTFQSANLAASEFDNVYVFDTQNVTLAQKALVLRAEELARQGMDAKSILEILEKEREEVHLIALLDTLEYLKKGGRISSAAALAGTVLNIKPVIAIEDGEVKVIGKARGSKKANNMLKEYVNKFGGIDYDRPYFVGYTGLDDALAEKYVQDSKELWKDENSHPDIHTVGGAIGTHAGPGAIALAFFGKKAD